MTPAMTAIATRIYRLPARFWAWLNTPTPYHEFTERYLEALRTQKGTTK
jgi:hypothetical protein